MENEKNHDYVDGCPVRGFDGFCGGYKNSRFRIHGYGKSGENRQNGKKGQKGKEGQKSEESKTNRGGSDGNTGGKLKKIR
jgi:hypothetical protein